MMKKAIPGQTGVVFFLILVLLFSPLYAGEVIHDAESSPGGNEKEEAHELHELTRIIKNFFSRNLWANFIATSHDTRSHPETNKINQKFLRGSRGQFFQKAPPGRRRQNTQDPQPRDTGQNKKPPPSNEEIEVETLLNKAEYYQHRDYQKAVKYANQALIRSREINYLEGEGKALLILGREYRQLRDSRKALSYGENALEVFKKTGGKTNIIITLNHIAETYVDIGRLGRAHGNFMEALKINEEIGDKQGIASSLVYIGMTYTFMGELDKPFANFFRALKIYREINDKYGITNCLRKIGTTYYKKGDYNNALNYLQEALKSKLKGDEDGDAYALSLIGQVYSKLKEYHKALKYLFRALSIWEQLDDRLFIAGVLTDIGQQYFLLKDYKKALEYYNKGLKVRENMKEKSLIALSLINIGDFYLKLKNYNKAIQSLNRCLKIAVEIKSTDLENNAYKSLSRVYELTGQYKLARENYERYHRTVKKLLDENSNRQINHMMFRYEVEKKQKELELLKIDNEIRAKDSEVLKKNNEIQRLQISKATITRNAFIIGFLLVSIILVLLFKKYLPLVAFWKKQKYVGQFKLVEKIGSGAMGTVYKAHSILDKSKIAAVKVLKDEFFTNTTYRARFKREATIIDKLEHPHIIRIFERGEYKQQLFIAMEFLEGKTLEHKINEDGQLPLQECLHIMKQISETLVLIHSKNIIHRDLKPANIMLIERNGHQDFVKLLDFGLARMELQTRLTQSGNFIGTLEYMAPEQVTEGHTSPANDIFSLGVIFYRMLSQRLPFVGETAVEIMREIINKTPLDVSTFRMDIPEEFNNLLKKMLDKKPGQRPSAKWIRNTLQSIASGGQGGTFLMMNDE